MAKTIVAKGIVKRKPGKMYFVDKNGNVVETTMNRKGGKKGRKSCATPKKKVAAKKTAKKAAPKKIAKKAVAKKKVTAKKPSPKTQSKRGGKKK